MNIAVPGMLGTDAKAQYLCTLFRGEALHQFDFLYANVEVTNPLTAENIISGLPVYF